MALRHIKTKRSLKDETSTYIAWLSTCRLSLRTQGLTLALRMTQSAVTKTKTQGLDNALTVCMHMMFLERR